MDTHSGPPSSAGGGEAAALLQEVEDDPKDGPHMSVSVVEKEIEDHVWFEDRWMVASLCDE
jgi:hypothetical protein